MKKKTKLIFLMKHIITGGIEVCLLQILQSLKDDNQYDITVFSLNKVTNERFLSFFQKNNIKLIDDGFFRYYFKARPRKFLKRKIWRIKRKLEVLRFKRYLNKEYDVVIDYFNGCFCGFLKGVSKPTAAFLHCSIPAYVSNKHYLRDMGQYTKIVSISKSFYDDMLKLHPEKKEQLEFIYNPIDVRYIHERKNKAEIPKLDHKYFVSVARLHEDKDHETLLRGFKCFMIKENNPDVKLYLCGDGPLRKEWEKLVNTLGLDDKVVFLGNIKNTFGYVAGAMAHILSTFGEGLPTVLIEAQAIGTVNIASNVKSGVAEILMNGRSGLLFEPQDYKDLATKLSDIYHSRVNIDDMKKLALSGLDRFDSEQIISKIKHLIDKLKK